MRVGKARVLMMGGTENEGAGDGQLRGVEVDGSRNPFEVVVGVGL